MAQNDNPLDDALPKAPRQRAERTRGLSARREPNARAVENARRNNEAVDPRTHEIKPIDEQAIKNAAAMRVAAAYQRLPPGLRRFVDINDAMAKAGGAFLGAAKANPQAAVSAASIVEGGPDVDRVVQESLNSEKPNSNQINDLIKEYAAAVAATSKKKDAAWWAQAYLQDHPNQHFGDALSSAADGTVSGSTPRGEGASSSPAGSTADTAMWDPIYDDGSFYSSNWSPQSAMRDDYARSREWNMDVSEQEYRNRFDYGELKEKASENGLPAGDVGPVPDNNASSALESSTTDAMGNITGAAAPAPPPDPAAAATANSGFNRTVDEKKRFTPLDFGKQQAVNAGQLPFGTPLTANKGEKKTAPVTAQAATPPASPMDRLNALTSGKQTPPANASPAQTAQNMSTAKLKGYDALNYLAKQDEEAKKEEKEIEAEAKAPEASPRDYSTLKHRASGSKAYAETLKKREEAKLAAAKLHDDKPAAAQVAAKADDKPPENKASEAKPTDKKTEASRPKRHQPGFAAHAPMV